MNVDKQRSGFLLGITLNELVFLLFFLLVLITSVNLKEKVSEIEELSEQGQTSHRRLEEQQINLDEAFKKLEERDKIIAKLTGSSTTDAAKALDEAFRNLVEAKSLREDLEKTSEERDELTERVNELEDYKNAFENIAGQEIGENAGDVKDLCLSAVSEAGRLKGQMAYAQRQLNKCKGNGLDHPPCWANEQGRIEYLLKVTIHENDLRVESAWPAYRKSQLSEMPSVVGLTDKTVSVSDFIELADPIFNWSVVHNCRHFVYIKDTPNTSKESYKNKRWLIEKYFYKLELRN